MGRINILDKDTSNKIAAGEVVERPSSVVKELVENSIDANAKNITVEIEDGGARLIRIIDDGDGIVEEDIEKAFMPHATSKITKVEDIYSITSLGFRGEALPSIASVAKVTLKSKPVSQEFGKEIAIEGGEVLERGDSSLNNGTIIEVQDLFYNVPARKKFLKSSSKEASAIGDIITRIALANPDISIKYFNNGKKVVHTYGNGKIVDTIRTIYGKQISESIIYFENPGDKITIHGYIGSEEIARGSRTHQSIYVNGRYIKNRTLTVAVENAFKSFATCNKFPFFVLFIEIYPEFVDVNIHPTKSEIKFDNERAIFKMIFDAVHKSLREEVMDSFNMPEEDLRDKEVVFQTEVPEIEKISFDIKEKTDVKLPIELNINNESDFEYTTPNNTVNEYTSQLVNEPVNKPAIISNEIYVEDKQVNEASLDSGATLGKSNEVYSTCNIEHKSYDTRVYIPDTQAKFPKLDVIGQFNKTYILAQQGEILYMIDQHAAHEKILFEKYYKDIKNQSIVIQPLLVPSVVHLSLDDYAVYEENLSLFNDTGFTVEDFGSNSVILKEVPYFLGKIDSKSLFLSMIDDLKNLGFGKPIEIKYNKIASMACRAAVKANDYLTNLEMSKLIEELRFIDDPFHCPHGRPTIIKYTSYELDKKFRRIV